MSDHLEFVPPFLSPLTHDEHARLGRIAILWGQIDMILDQMLNIAMGITGKQRMTLVGEKPIGIKLAMLARHFDDIPVGKPRETTERFWELANETKDKRNRCFHGVWGLRCTSRKAVEAAAMHFKDGNDPVRATELAALEKKLCRTARVGATALGHVSDVNSIGCVRLFHGKCDTPAWLQEWIEQHPVGDHSLDHNWKQGELPFLGRPL